MKEFDDFSAAVDSQTNAVGGFISAHSNVNNATSDLTSKASALKSAIDTEVKRACAAADAAKSVVDVPTLPTALGDIGGIPIPTVGQTVTNADPAPTVATT